jgi:hypothetical protein
MGAYDKDTGIQPAVRDALNALAAGLSGDIVINILTDVVTPAPTASVWSYTVAFELTDTAGNRLTWYNGNLTAAASDNSSAGSASVSDATPAVVNGYGTVDLEGDAAAWLNTEVATLTIDGTISGTALTEKTWTATFTTA